MKTFEERKQEIIDACNIEYANKKFSWWKQRQKVYKTTLETAANLDSQIQTSTTILIRKNFYEILLWIVAICIFGYPLALYILHDSVIFIRVLISLFFIGVVVYQITRLRDREPKIIFTEKDFWFSKMSKPINWKHLITSVIKTERKGNNTLHSLLIHYYDESTDCFKKIEFDYFNLEMDIEDICFHIEKFKAKANQLHNNS
jgi:hypothetical protein